MILALPQWTVRVFVKTARPPFFSVSRAGACLVGEVFCWVLVLLGWASGQPTIIFFSPSSFDICRFPSTLVSCFAFHTTLVVCIWGHCPRRGLGGLVSSSLFCCVILCCFGFGGHIGCTVFSSLLGSFFSSSCSPKGPTVSCLLIRHSFFRLPFFPILLISGAL